MLISRGRCRFRAPYQWPLSGYLDTLLGAGPTHSVLKPLTQIKTYRVILRMKVRLPRRVSFQYVSSCYRCMAVGIEVVENITEPSRWWCGGSDFWGVRLLGQGVR